MTRPVTTLVMLNTVSKYILVTITICVFKLKCQLTRLANYAYMPTMLSGLDGMETDEILIKLTSREVPDATLV